MKYPTAEYLLSLLSYNPFTGVVTRLSNGREYLGNPRYRSTITLDGCSYMMCRIIWIMHYDEEPPEVIHYLDGDTSNNKISNLKAMTKSEHCHHMTEGRGYHFDTRCNKYIVRIEHKGYNNYYGRFKTKEEAERRAKYIREQLIMREQLTA